MSLHSTDNQFIFGVAMNNGHDMSRRGSMLLHLIAFDQASVRRMRH